MNIGNINSVRGPEEVKSVRIPPQVAPFRPIADAPLPKDSAQVEGAAPAEPAAPQKSLSELRADFKASLGQLSGQNDEDKQAVKDIAKEVDKRADLNSKEKEWLFATEVFAYTTDVAMQMTGWDKKGQPWTPKQQTRFEAISTTNGAAQALMAAVEPTIAKPESPPPFESGVPGNNTASESGNSDPAKNDPANPAPQPSSDPLVRIWESRRQEAQDMYNDYKAFIQKMNDWKARIAASRIAFFWKVYNMHAGFIADSWRK